MEQLVDDGLVRSIGVSNFGKTLLEELMAEARIMPAVNQIELHPRLAQFSLVDFCLQHKIMVAAWSPLSRFDEELMHSSTVSSIARSHGVSAPQVILRWHIERGCCVIPRSKSRNHIRDNGDIFKFELTEKERAQIDSLDCQKRITRDFIGVFEGTAHFPWHLVGIVLNVTLEAAFTFFIPRIIDFKMPQTSVLELFDLKRISVFDAMRLCTSASLVFYSLQWLLF